MNTNKKNKTMWKAKIEGGKYLYDVVPLVTNRWIDTPPYATLQDVLIQDANGKVSLGWADSYAEQGKDGRYRYSIRGGDGAETLKYYMIVPFPFDDPTGWVIFGDESREPRKGQKYLITVETEDACRMKHYRLEIGWYKPGKYSDWDGYDYKECKSSVIAWRTLPMARR